MVRARLLAVTALLVGLGGCAQYTSFVGSLPAKIATINQSTVSALLATNQAIAAAAPSIQSLAADIQVAFGYFQQIVGTGVISPKAQALVNKSMVVVNALANNPPQDITSAVGALAAIKTNIQNLSTVPNGVKAVTIPVVATPATPVTAPLPAASVTVPATGN